MNLVDDLISQFVKATNDTAKPVQNSTVYGTVIYNDRAYVKLDGSELLTPVTTTTTLKDGDRVAVKIENHSATVTGNITSPSAQYKDVEGAIQAANKISEFEILVAYRVTTEELAAAQASIDSLRATIAEIESLEVEDFTAVKADIEKLEADFAALEYVYADDVEALNATITNLQAQLGNFVNIDTDYLDALYADINKLKSYTADFTYVSADVLKAIKAEVKNLSVENLETVYANIDFSNIGQAAIEKFFSKSGLIEDVVVGDGTVTGMLVGVTIKGDLIEGGTVVADKLVIQGKDGLYYKLNTDGVKTEAEQTDYNSLNGSIITAQSITASKIAVDDLVAFDATIGGFNITDEAIYSGVKSEVGNTTRGTYLDKDGQVAFGDGSNFIKYYKDTDGTYKLALSASSIIFASTNKNVQESISELSEDAENALETADTAKETADNAETLILQLVESIATLVTDGNGTSLMEQTAEGWTFSTADIQSAVASTAESLAALEDSTGDTANTVEVLRQAVADLGEIAEYVKIRTYESEPCIELGESDSDFKLLITNTRILFMEGSSIVAYINNQSLYIKKAVIEEELQQGKFVWQARSNGNLGLIWKGGTS